MELAGKFLTQHMADTFEKESCPDFMVYGYVEKLTDHYDLNEAQLNHVFDILHDTDRYELDGDEYILYELYELSQEI